MTMRTRKTIAILGVGLILACCIMIYLMMDLTLFPSGQNSKFSMNDVSYDIVYVLFYIYMLEFFNLL